MQRFQIKHFDYSTSCFIYHLTRLKSHQLALTTDYIKTLSMEHEVKDLEVILAQTLPTILLLIIHNYTVKLVILLNQHKRLEQDF